MSKISVKFPKQGFSGSITCFVSPFDGSGRKCKELFVKIYDEHAKAFQEYRNALEYVDKYNIDYPRHQHYRRYQGIGYSLMVTECTRGPHNRSWTFFDIIKTDTVPINDIRFFLRKLLAILNKWNIRQEKVDLVDCYLGKILKNDNRRRKLESDNRCHRWFGIFTDGLDIEKKTRNFFQEMGIEGTAIGICHGDLHLNNILVKTEGKRLVPVLIDFSRTGSTHFMTDCVTIEIDLIIRGIEGIKAFIDIDTLSLFLNSLETKGQAKRFIQKTKMNKRDMLRIRKIFMIIEMIRAYAYSTYQVSPLEYIGSALLKTLEVLSYGMLPFDQNARATVYVDYLISGIISAKK
jgi:hypothetical protein